MKELLKLARDAIESEFNGKELNVNEVVKKKYNEKGASFVTLTLDGELRGCIGTLEAHQELWKDVVQNARHAAFNDYRFSPLTENEVSKIKIEVSVLTKPEKLDFKDADDLLKKIDMKIGLILKKDGKSATFLPQVWEEVSVKQEFLEHLSRKAGLDKDAWKDNCEVFFYRVEKVKE